VAVGAPGRPRYGDQVGRCTETRLRNRRGCHWQHDHCAEQTAADAITTRHSRAGYSRNRSNPSCRQHNDPDRAIALGDDERGIDFVEQLTNSCRPLAEIRQAFRDSSAWLPGSACATTVQAMSASRSAIAAASADSPRSIDRSITNTLRRRSIHAIRALHPGCANRLSKQRTVLVYPAPAPECAGVRRCRISMDQCGATAMRCLAFSSESACQRCQRDGDCVPPLRLAHRKQWWSDHLARSQNPVCNCIRRTVYHQ